MKPMSVFFVYAVAILLASGCVGPGRFSHIVTVYSYMTPSGQQIPAPSAAQPTPCLLVNGGYQQLGDPASNEPTPIGMAVAAMVGDALATNWYQCIRLEEVTPTLVVVYHWGSAIPDYSPEERRLPSMGDLQILDLVGGRALKNADLESEQLAILSAATDERYFVSAAAYRYTVHAPHNIGTLVWRTQISVPRDGLTLERAIPLLTSTGAALFGRETLLPRRIHVLVQGVFRSK